MNELYSLYEARYRDELEQHLAWVAPEHARDAMSMSRDDFGNLIIELNSIIRYSAENPPYWLTKK